MKELSQALAEWLGGHIPDPFANRRVNESLLPYLREFVTERSSELIQSLYAVDFETFGYGKQVPATNETISCYRFDLAFDAISLIRGRHRRLGERNRQVASLSQAVAEREGQVASLSQAVAEREGQVASLSQAVAEREGQIASLSQAVAEREGQIASLSQAVAERKGQIASLSQAVAEREGQIASLSQKVADRDELVIGLNVKMVQDNRERGAADRD